MSEEFIFLISDWTTKLNKLFMELLQVTLQQNVLSIQVGGVLIQVGGVLALLVLSKLITGSSVESVVKY